MACLISTLLKKLILLLFSLLISKTQHNCELGNIGTTQAIIRNCLRGDNQFACWKEKRSSSLEGCQQHGFMEQNFAGKGLSINGNLKFTKSVCISARFRILKYLLCQHIINSGPFFWPESRFQPKSGPAYNFAIQCKLKKSTSYCHEKILKMV